MLGGVPGIGNHTLLEPIRAAVGPWNLVDVSPPHLLGRSKGFLKSVIQRMSDVLSTDTSDGRSVKQHATKPAFTTGIWRTCDTNHRAGSSRQAFLFRRCQDCSGTRA